MLLIIVTNRCFMETKYNFQQQAIRGKRTQTMVFDPKLTSETDELNPDFQEAAQEMVRSATSSKSLVPAPQDTGQSAEDYGLNHDQGDELSLNIADRKPLK